MSLYIGLISGTSADAVNAALVRFTGDSIELQATSVTPIPPALRRQILDLYSPGFDEIDRFGVLDRQLGKLFGDCALQLLASADIPASSVNAIGSHGQTIRHRPTATLPFTVQIADPNTIAQVTGIPTVADFRRRDIACGGEGAPLAPGLHHALFASPVETRTVLNIGGIANLTILPAEGAAIGFDTGPGNGLMDSWVHRHLGADYDQSGHWAATGRVHAELLTRLLAHTYFTQPPPKSTGREEFTLAWIDQMLSGFPNIPPADVQATLLQLTVDTIADAVAIHCPLSARVYVCGGGIHNDFLVERLRARLDPRSLSSTAELGLDPDWVEAVTFAWLAMRTRNNLFGNLKDVTGAQEDAVLGCIYPGSNARGLI